MAVTIRGKGVISGIAVGKIMLAGQNLDGYLVNYQPGDVEQEKEKAEGALTAVADILSESVERMQKNEAQKEQAAIMEAHRMMVQDPALHDSIIGKIGLSKTWNIYDRDNGTFAHLHIENSGIVDQCSYAA